MGNIIGVVLASIGSLFVEVSSAIGKAKVTAHKEGIYTMAFLTYFWGFLWFGGIIAYKQTFLFSVASLPTFLIRVVLEIILTYITISAVVKAERSTFSFVRVLTMPLLLLVDVSLGYHISSRQIVGIAVVIATLLVLFFYHGLKHKGLGLSIMSATIAVVTISLYKYDIVHFNSVETEQFLIYAILLTLFFVASIRQNKENPVRLLSRLPYFKQSFSNGLATLVGSFAYVFIPASVVVSAQRSSSVLWALLSGNVYFGEKKIFVKILIATLLISGIILLV